MGDYGKAKYPPTRPGYKAIEATGSEIRRVLVEQDSLFAPGNRVWSPENFSILRKAFVENPDTSGSRWALKLSLQLNGSPPEVIRLFAEMFFINLAPLSDYKESTKRELIQQVLTLANVSLSDAPPVIQEALAAQIYKGGVGFKMLRFYQLSYLIERLGEIISMPEQSRIRISEDPILFRDSLDEIEAISQKSQRRSLLFLTFPDFFAPMVSTEHLEKYRDTFIHILDANTGDIDLDSRRINDQQSAEIGRWADPYVPPYIDQWKPFGEPDETATGPVEAVQRSWFVRGSNVGGEDLSALWVKEGFISLRASQLGPVSLPVSKDRLSWIVDDSYSDHDQAQRKQKTEEFYRFLSRVNLGDKVATVSGETLLVGTVLGEPEFHESFNNNSNLRRAVSWENIAGLQLESLSKQLKNKLRSGAEIVEITKMFAPYLEDEPADYGESEITVPPATEELSESLFIDPSWLNEVIDLLSTRNQLIFYGPPGTGKTFIAKSIAQHVAGLNFKIVQFHPSYSYEDFFEGYRPKPSGGFELRVGPLRRIAAEASEHPNDPYVLVIDEINRGDIAKIFGELYFLLEYRDEGIELLYSESGSEPFVLPPNLFILGTMNTADRSIALFDSALRRRFSFVPLFPSEPPTVLVLERWLEKNGSSDEPARLLRELNKSIPDANFEIGPSYLMRSEVTTEEGLQRIWDYSILPLLEEHHFGEFDRAEIKSRYGLDAIRAGLS